MKRLQLFLIGLYFLLGIGEICYSATIDVKVKDFDHNNLVTKNDVVEKVYENGFFETFILKPEDVTQVASSSFDINNDDKVQLSEYEKYLNHVSNATNIVNFIPVIKEKVKATFYDLNHNGYIDVNEPYKYIYISGKKEIGKVKASLLSAVTNANYDKDGKITTIEMLNYFNSLRNFIWEIELINDCPQLSNYNLYTLITDKNKNNIVDVNEKFVHYSLDDKFNITFKESGLITQQHIDTIILSGYDINNDGQVQKEEFQNATLGLLNKTCLLTFVPPVIDTRNYWSTLKGNVWEYENYLDNSKLSWMHIIPGHIYGRNVDAFFYKAVNDTYWGYPAPMSARMGLYWNLDKSDSLDPPNLAASSSRSYTNAFDNNADNMVYWSNTHPDAKTKYADYWNVKTKPCQGQIPYIIFPVTLDVDNFVVDSLQGQFHMKWDASGQSIRTEEDNHPWKIKYEWFYLKTTIGYEGPALRLSCDELFAVPSIYEDWYFVEGLGVLRIEQYTSTERTEKIVQVNASKVFLN